ncbi:OLC1v1027026C2 [Oldenlandia corymbosa var. corymbosa]|uniref:OLC1v1027026C2 n=1 Tax=Oldenlandia corymbosa var. corymbosa TaxID=529605 RepID=A0AAV1C8Z1_OLDCO|nr:OLC1v1027026C2 [Oldenlandia corymbosa var. corymbosa]
MDQITTFWVRQKQTTLLYINPELRKVSSNHNRYREKFDNQPLIKKKMGETHEETNPRKVEEEEANGHKEEVVGSDDEEFSKDGKKISSHHHHFVLVHGISHGAWCWYKIRTLMENSGYKVTCIDLKGAGIDRTDPDTIFSFQDYNQPLLDFLSDLPDGEQVILVGHSAGGLNVTDATYKYPQKIRLVVYVAATMLKRGLFDQQDVKDYKPKTGEENHDGGGRQGDGTKIGGRVELHANCLSCVIHLIYFRPFCLSSMLPT